MSCETKPRVGVCAWCGATFEQPATGRPGRFCKSAHRLRAHRERRASASFVSSLPAPAAPVPIEELRRRWFALSAADRNEMRKSIAAAAIERAEAGLAIRAADRALFANDPGRVRR